MAAYEQTVVERFKAGDSFVHIAVEDDGDAVVIERIVRTWLIAYEEGANARWSETAEGLSEHDGL